MLLPKVEELAAIAVSEVASACLFVQHIGAVHDYAIAAIYEYWFTID